MTRSATWGIGWLALVAAMACAPPSPPPPARLSIDTVLIRNVTRVLAHDSLRGREAGTLEAASAAQYIAATCRALGLTPVAGRYLHPLPLANARLDGSTLTLSARSVQRRLLPPADYLPTGMTGGTLRSFAGRAAWLGSGADIIAMDSMELGGHVAVVTDPLLAPDAADRLIAAGAEGYVSVLTSEDQRAYIEDLRGSAPLFLRDSVRSSFHPALPGVALFQRGTRELVLLATTRDFDRAPVDLGVDIAVETTVVPDTTVRHHNVLCAREGRAERARDTAIVLTAHYDHLGTSNVASDGDSIFNGFSDNAAGVAMLLAVGAALPTPRHTVILAFFSAEEKGLLGSDYLVARSPWPLTRMLAVINLDAGAPPAPHWNWRLAGGDSSPLGDLARDVASRQGWTATTSAARANSDYYPFWREGVPSIFIVPGTGPYEGLTADSSDALRARWDRYHHLEDEWAADFPFAGLGRYAEYALRVAAELDRRGLP